MTQIQTSRDIFTTISLRAPEFNNPMSLTVKYRISQRNILTGKDLPSTDAQVRVIDQAEQVTPTFDEDGNPDGMTTTPAITDLTDLIASATTPAEFWNAMLQKAIEHADLTEWDESIFHLGCDQLHYSISQAFLTSQSGITLRCHSLLQFALQQIRDPLKFFSKLSPHQSHCLNVVGLHCTHHPLHVDLDQFRNVRTGNDSVSGSNCWYKGHTH